MFYVLDYLLFSFFSSNDLRPGVRVSQVRTQGGLNQIILKKLKHTFFQDTPLLSETDSEQPPVTRKQQRLFVVLTSLSKLARWMLWWSHYTHNVNFVLTWNICPGTPASWSGWSRCCGTTCSAGTGCTTSSSTRSWTRGGCWSSAPGQTRRMGNYKSARTSRIEYIKRPLVPFWALHFVSLSHQYTYCTL